MVLPAMNIMWMTMMMIPIAGITTMAQVAPTMIAGTRIGIPEVAGILIGIALILTGAVIGKRKKCFPFSGDLL